MDLPKLGHAVIVNNIASEMPGSNEDVKALKEAYETVGFDVKVHENCSVKVSSVISAVKTLGIVHFVSNHNLRKKVTAIHSS